MSSIQAPGRLVEAARKAKAVSEALLTPAEAP